MSSTFSVLLDVTPISGEERTLFHVLIRRGEYNTRGINLSQNRKIEIQKAAARIRMDLCQAFSLRRQILCWKFGKHGVRTITNQSQQAQYSRSFESVILDYLIGVKGIDVSNIMTEDDQKVDKSKGTPDILFKTPIYINGRLISWLECKAYYASAMILRDKTCKNPPIRKVSKQIARYTEEYGDGAIIFLRGFHVDLLKEWEDCLLLDCTDIDTSDFSNQQ